MKGDGAQGKQGLFRGLGRMPGRTASRLSMRSALEAQDDIATTLLSVRSESRGLVADEAARRLRRQGRNRMSVPSLRRRRSVLAAAFSDLQSLSLLLLAGIAVLVDPANLTGLLLVLGLIFLTALGALLRNQRNRQTVISLNELASTSTAVLRRDGPLEDPEWRTVNSDELVRGDIVQLGAGFRVPADVRLIETQKLFVDQSLMTGDTGAVRKFASGTGGQAVQVHSDRFDPPSLPNVCLTGSFVLSGTGTGVVVATGEQTYYGSIARALLHDHGYAWEVQFGAHWFLPRLALLLPVAWLLRAGFAQGELWQLAVFVLAAALYLLPELLPGLFLPRAVRPELERGALASMSGWLGLLRGRGERRERFADADVELVNCLDAAGTPSQLVLGRAWLMSSLKTVARTSVDAAVLAFAEAQPEARLDQDYQRLDEIPYDLRRRRHSLVAARADGQHLLISVGGPEEIMETAVELRIDGRTVRLDQAARQQLQQVIRTQTHQGWFVQLLASRFIPPNRAKRLYSRSDERDLTIDGMLVLSAQVEPVRQDREQE